MTGEDAGRVVERLLVALAAQVGASSTASLTPAALEALTGLGRDEANLIYGHAGHLVHYGAETKSLELLIELITDLQRGEADADATFLPGDKVRMEGDPPSHLAAYDANWLRETVFVVRYVGDDGTIDVQPELIEDYVIETVPTTILKAAH